MIPRHLNETRNPTWLCVLISKNATDAKADVSIKTGSVHKLLTLLQQLEMLPITRVKSGPLSNTALLASGRKLYVAPLPYGDRATASRAQLFLPLAKEQIPQSAGYQQLLTILNDHHVLNYLRASPHTAWVGADVGRLQFKWTVVWE